MLSSKLQITTIFFILLTFCVTVSAKTFHFIFIFDDNKDSSGQIADKAMENDSLLFESLIGTNRSQVAGFNLNYQKWSLSNATTSSLVNKITALKSRMSNQDALWIYFSSHGQITRDENYITNYYLDTGRTTVIDRTALLNAMMNTNARLKIFISDACNSKLNDSTNKSINHSTNFRFPHVEYRELSDRNTESYTPTYDYDNFRSVIDTNLWRLLNQKGFYNVFAAKRGELALSKRGKNGCFSIAYGNCMCKAGFPSLDRFLDSVNINTTEMASQILKTASQHPTWSRFLTFGELNVRWDQCIRNGKYTGVTITHLENHDMTCPAKTMGLSYGDIILAITPSGGRRTELNTYDDFKNFILQHNQKGLPITVEICLEGSGQIVTRHATLGSDFDLMFGASVISYAEYIRRGSEE